MNITLDRYAGPEKFLSATGVPSGADVLVFAKAVRRTGGRAVFIARDDTRAANFSAGLKILAPDIAHIKLPAWDCLPYDRVSPGRLMGAWRAGALYMLANAPQDLPLIIVTTVNAITQKVPPRSVMKTAGLSAVVGGALPRETLEDYFVKNGYSRTAMVIEPGDYALRGGIVDVFPPDAKHPIRLDFFGDDVESIRRFDAQTQRTIEGLKEVRFAPVSEILMDEGRRLQFRKSYIEAFGGGISADPIYAAVSEGIRQQGVEHWLPCFYDKLETVMDYIGKEALYGFDMQFNEAYEERWALIDDYYDTRAVYARDRDSGSGDPGKSKGLYRPLPPDALYISPEKWKAVIGVHRQRHHTPFIKEGDSDQINFDGNIARNFSPERRREGQNVFEAVASHISELQAQKKRVILASWTQGSSERLGSVFEDHGVVIGQKMHGQDALTIPKGSLCRLVLPLEQGFDLGDLVVISEQDILGDRLVTRSRKKRAKNFISEATALQNGDLIVHIDHGLGRYVGLKTLDVTGAPHDCLELEYANKSRLYLPVENIELLSRYGSAPETVMLDRLGGAAWQSRKARAKKKLQDMAAELIKIAAKRAMRRIDPIVNDPANFNSFCAHFPYAETDDQLSAIEDVIGDIEKGRPMDRLICGDVGFGKTEVALRAAFTVAMSGRQVAIVAPTTILSRQHYQTFKARFKGWPVRIDQLSRLVSSQKAKLTKEALKSGQCDIVIGTHTLLAKSVDFKNLGLIIVDEEQRFGVKHKERLKSLRADIHVLTLTATPIPRTLQMALSGIRDLSLIATPPVDRLAVRTYTAPFDPVSVRKAILREKYRGGQSFIVAPRIADLDRLEGFLRDDVPEVKYIMAHGQMSPRDIEDIMTAFYDGQYDVLLSTSIIESGIDIPRANTLIVYRADKFGLAQLYQMRGRVGRSKLRAYAYMTLPDTHVATKAAIQRLKILQSLDTLGAGFTLASHDLDMRGGGNPLGEEQSGHIKDLGVELYQHMLEEAVAELKDDDSRLDRSWSPQVNLGVAVLIPETYIEDLNLRLMTYRRISEIADDEEGEALAAELIDRFGALPDEVQSLFKVMKIKRLCRNVSVEKIDAGPKGAALTIRHQDVKDPSRILSAITRNPGWRLRPDQTIFAHGQFEDPKSRLKGVERILRNLQEASN